MDFLWDAIAEWLKEILVSGIMSNLSGMFDSVNEKVGEISTQVGMTPQAWNGSIFNMVQSLSENVIMPIAGVILAFVMTLELVQILMDKNNFHDVETVVFFKWVFKTACAILIVTNTWTIVMGIFDVAQGVVNQASGIIIGNTSIDLNSVMPDMEERLMEMELGPLFGLWFQSLFVGITMWALTICIFIITYGRMLEIYLVTSVAPIPMAAMLGREWGGMGQNYIKSLFALGFQAFLIMVCVAIYAVLVQNISTSGDISTALWTCMGYTVLLCFTLFKTGSLAKSVFSAHCFLLKEEIVMNENTAPETSAAQPAKLDMDVRVYPSKEEGNLLAFASVTLGGCFAVKGIKIMDSEKGAFVAMPDRKDAKGEYHDICFPTTAEMRQALNTAVLSEYQKVMELIAARGEKARPSVRDALQNTAKAAERPAMDKANAPRQKKTEKEAR